ncbi:hypothetical protein MPSEU_000478500 [Mayamaea pseudoterrestris]|nr:hypothetical protein MPSEU_000478500 [Mayamaea pseudoterrestris]
MPSARQESGTNRESRAYGTSMSDESSSEEEEFRGSEDDNIKASSSAAAQSSDDDRDDDDEPIASLKTPGLNTDNSRSSPRRNNSKASIKYDEESDDDDDDVPLANLIKKKEPKRSLSAASNASNGSAAQKKKKTTSDAPKAKKAKPETTKSSTASSSSSCNKKYEFASEAFYGTECVKGLLVQRLLCRWWYAIDWPKKHASKTVPVDYEPLDGFPGVYVCTTASNPGHLLDTRNMDECPSFQNFAKKHASELQSLLQVALQEQKKQLVEVEGSGTSTEKGIEAMIKWTNKVNPEKAEKEAAKILKASKFKL